MFQTGQGTVLKMESRLRAYTLIAEEIKYQNEYSTSSRKINMQEIANSNYRALNEICQNAINKPNDADTCLDNLSKEQESMLAKYQKLNLKLGEAAENIDSSDPEIRQDAKNTIRKYEIYIGEMGGQALGKQQEATAADKEQGIATHTAAHYRAMNKYLTTLGETAEEGDAQPNKKLNRTDVSLKGKILAEIAFENGQKNVDEFYSHHDLKMSFQ